MGGGERLKIVSPNKEKCTCFLTEAKSGTLDLPTSMVPNVEAAPIIHFYIYIRSNVS